MQWPFKISGAGDESFCTMTAVRGEDWRSVVGYGGAYSASNLGRIKSESRPGRLRAKTLSPCIGSSGYLYVNLRKNGKSASRTAHSLVAEAFLGPRPHLAQVNHIDGNKLNNAANNLEYVTHTENAKHSRDVLGKNHRGEKHGNAKLTDGIVFDIRNAYRSGRFTQRWLAERYGVDQSLVSKIVSNKGWKHLENQGDYQ